MVTRAQVVAQAREWIGTPFRHQGHTRGLGCDCAGIVRGVMIELGLMPADPHTWPGADEFVGYQRQPNGGALIKAARMFMREIGRAEMQPGDVIVIDWGMGPQHFGILGDYRHGGLSIIQALSVGKRGHVVEHRLDSLMMRRFVAAFALPGVD